MTFDARAVSIQDHLKIVGGHSCDYEPLSSYGLKSSQEIISGDGSIKSPYKIHVTVRNEGSEDFNGIILFALSAKDPERADFQSFYLPGFMYGLNRGESPWKVDCKFPRLRASVKNPLDSDCPLSSFYMVRSDRLSHPCAIMLDKEKNHIIAFHSLPYILDGGKFLQYGGFYCNSARGEIGFTFGYENAPWLFVQSHLIKKRQAGENYFVLAKGKSLQWDFYAYDFDAHSPLQVHDVIKCAYDFYHQSPRKAATVEESVKNLSLAVCDYAWLPDEKIYSGFVRETSEEGVFSYNKIPSISWTNGIVVAYPQLLASVRLKNHKMREQALQCIQNIVDFSLNRKSNLPYETCDSESGVWSCRGWWYDGMHTGGHSAYLDGQFVYYLLKAYLFEKEKGSLHDDWLAFASTVTAVFERERNGAGEYPFIFSEEDGTGLEYDSLGSSWCLAATALYSLVLRGMKECPDNLFKPDLAELEKSLAHYEKQFVEKLECYGAPLDTDKAPDNEGILAFLRASSCLHQLTEKDLYLEYMKNALCHEFSYKFCYNGRIAVPPLSEIGWSSCGGSITSVCNPHIHPMSSSVVSEMRYYVEHTPPSSEWNQYVKSRLEDTVRWGCQTYNLFEGEYGYGRLGWMSERFCYSQGLLTEKYPDGSPSSTWFALMPWASSSVLEGLLDYSTEI